MQKNRARLFAGFLALVAMLFSRPASASPDISDLRQWMVDRMASWSPPGRSFIAGAKETHDEGIVRYGEIAESIIAVAYDPQEKPLFPGKFGRARTAALLASIALFESGYRKDVDLNLGPQARGDGGRSWCMVQVQLGKPNPATGKTDLRIALTKEGYEFTKDTSRGWSGEDLISDRRNCFRAGLRMASSSFTVCRNLPVLERLSAYTAGNCLEGRNSSKVRVEKAVTWLTDHPVPFSDAVVMQLLAPAPPILPNPSAFLPVVGSSS